jgi:hypothetical protein
MPVGMNAPKAPCTRAPNFNPLGRGFGPCGQAQQNDGATQRGSDGHSKQPRSLRGPFAAGEKWGGLIRGPSVSIFAAPHDAHFFAGKKS